MLEELLEGVRHLEMVRHLGPGAGEQCGLDGVEEGGQVVLHPALPHHDLLPGVTPHRHVLILPHIPRSNLHPAMHIFCTH